MLNETQHSLQYREDALWFYVERGYPMLGPIWTLESESIRRREACSSFIQSTP